MKKLAITVKHHVAPLQGNEVTVLRKKCAVFDVEQHKFRERFHQQAPFRLEQIAGVKGGGLVCSSVAVFIVSSRLPRKDKISQITKATNRTVP